MLSQHLPPLLGQ